MYAAINQKGKIEMREKEKTRGKPEGGEKKLIPVP